MLNEYYDYEECYVKRDNDKEWDSTKDLVSNCDYVKEISELESKIKEIKDSHDLLIKEEGFDNPIVLFSQEAIAKILGMLMKHQTTEFMVYLLGDAAKRHVTNIYVPQQKASAARVELDEDIEFAGIIGALHKHPGNLKPSFSGIDDNCLNVNHNISIVIPENGALPDWHCVVRAKTSCGCEKFVTGKIVTDVEALIEEDSKKVIKQTYMYAIDFACKYCTAKLETWILRDEHEKNIHAEEVAKEKVRFSQRNYYSSEFD